MSVLGRALGGDSQRFGGGAMAPWLIPPNSQSTAVTSSSGMEVTRDSAMGLSVVWACCRIISETISSLSLVAVDKPDANGLQRPLKKQPQIVVDPFGGNTFTGLGTGTLSRREGISETILSLLLQGNVFYEILERDPRSGRPTQLMLIAPQRVHLETDKTKGIILNVFIDGKVANKRDIVHLPGMRLPGEILGCSMIAYARRTIGLGIAAEEYGSRFFSNGATVHGLIEVAGDLSPDETRRLQRDFDSLHGGVYNAHQTAVLTGGAHYAPVGIPPEDAQFLGTRSAQTLDLAMMFGVPPHMLGQVDRTTSWGRGIEEQTLGFLKFTLKGWTDRIEDLWNSFMPIGQEVHFNYDELLSPDSSARYTAYQVARTASLFTINEIRAREGLPPVEGGDDIMAPLNSAHGNDPGYQLGDPTQPMTMTDMQIPDPGQPPAKKPKGPSKLGPSQSPLSKGIVK